MAFLLAVGLVVNICNIGVQCNTDTNYSSLHECLKSGHRDSWLDGWKHSEFGLPGNLKKGDRFKLAPKIWRFDMSWISIFQRFVSLSVLTCRVVIQELSRPQRPECSTSQFALKGTQIETRSSLKQFKSMRPTFTRVKFRVCLKLKLWLRGATSKASSCQNFQVPPEKYAGSAILYYTISCLILGQCDFAKYPLILRCRVLLGSWPLEQGGSQWLAWLLEGMQLLNARLTSWRWKVCVTTMAKPSKDLGFTGSWHL